MGDVARAANVSRALVSIVMRDVPGASERTRRHVREVADRLGYIPDARARLLRGQVPRTVGVAFQVYQPFHDSIIEGIYEHAEPAGFQVVLSAVYPARSEAQAIESLIAHRCGAVLTLGSQLAGARLRTLAERVPVIVLAQRVRATGVEWVCSEDADGLRQAVEYLVGLGHRDIAFLGSPHSAGNAERQQGYRQAMSVAGLTERIVAAGSTEDTGAQAAEQLLGGSVPTAVIGFNDRCAAGAMDVFIRAGLRIPQDISVVGFDDSSIAALGYRGLTSVRQESAELAKVATQRAITRIEGADDGRRGHRVPVTLTVRSSAAPPRPC